MKKAILSLFMVGVSAGAFAQGTILADNFPNTGVYGGAGGSAFNGTSGNPVYSSLVTSNGLIFTLDPAYQAGKLGYSVTTSQLLGNDSSFIIYGGPTAAAAGAETNVVLSVTGSTISGDNANWGQLGVAGTQTVKGTTAASPLYLDLQIWEGNTFSTYAAAVAGKDYVGDTGAFLNPSGGGATPASHMYGLPDVELNTISTPEPSVFALSGIGAAALMLIRRRK